MTTRVPLFQESKLDYFKVVTDANPENIQRARHVYRYSSLPTHHKESVAEHCWFVAFYSLMVADEWDRYARSVTGSSWELDREKLLTRVIVHDLDECLTGDFLRKFKYSDPNLRAEITKATEKLTREFIRANVPDSDPALAESYLRGWREDKHDDIEGRILEFCDLVAVVSYCVMEIRMGNLNFFQILDECFGYIFTIYDRKDTEFTPGWRDFLGSQVVRLCKDVRHALEFRPILHIDGMLAKRDLILV